MKRVFATLTTLIVISALPVSLDLAQEEPSPAGGTYAEFNGKDSFLVLEDGKLVDTEFEDFTVEAWIYIRSLPQVSGRWVIAAKPGSFELLISGPGPDPLRPATPPTREPFGYSFIVHTAAHSSLTFTGTIDNIESINDWHHVSGSFDGLSWSYRLSIDGAVFTGEGLPGLRGEDSPLYIGGTEEWEKGYFDGFIDEIRISDVVRYEDDFEPPMTPFKVDENTVALWHCDESKGFHTDSSGNGNTLVGKNVRSAGIEFPVEPAGKLAATWAGVKSGIRLQ